MSNQTSEETVMLLLPKDTSKKPMKTRLDVLGQVLVGKIIEVHGFKYIYLICKGKILSPDKRLDEQGVKNNSTIMVVVKENGVENDTDKLKLQMLKRTQIGLKILGERDGSKNPWTKNPWIPFLEITDQWGNSLPIPDKERKALIMALGFHEKGRSLMKKKDYDNAVCHLEMADVEFKSLEPSIRTAVDNFAVLQLDIVWCQRADLKKDPSSLDEARSRMQTAEKCFQGCYGENHERLRLIMGDAGIEKAQVLLVRFNILQSFLFYLENNNSEAKAKLTEVASLSSRLVPDPDKVNQLMVLGFTDTEARLALRACQGDLHKAVKHIIERRLEQEKVKKTERQKRQDARSRTNTASGLRFSPFTAAEEPSTSYNAEEEEGIVSDMLKDISPHEEDYLDLTLEEELKFINEMKTYLKM